MKPYYQDKGITIYHADARDILPHLGDVDLTLTDPPYGISGGRGFGNRLRKKGDYICTGWNDDGENVISVVIPVIEQCLRMSARAIVTPGNKFLFRYPEPSDIGCMWTPAGSSFSPWGIVTFHSVLYYGKDQRAGKGPLPTGKQVNVLRQEHPTSLPKAPEILAMVTGKREYRPRGNGARPIHGQRYHAASCQEFRDAQPSASR